MRDQLLIKNAFWSLASQALSRGTLMLSAILLARSLDTYSFATYSYFQLTISTLAAYASMGMGVTASRYFAEIGHEQEGSDPPPLGMLWFASMLFALLAFIVIIFLPSSWLNAGLGVSRWMIALGVLIVVLGIVPSGAMLGLEKYKATTIISATSGAVILLGTLQATLQHSSNLAMASLLLSIFIQSAGESAIVVHTIGLRHITEKLRYRKGDLKRVFFYAGPMLLVSILSASGYWLLGRLVLFSTGGEYAFALYTIGLQWFSLALLLPSAISKVTLPLIVRSGGSLDVHSSQNLVRQGVAMAMLAATGMTVGGLIFGPWLMSIYGSNYNAGRWYIGAFMAAAILSAPANIIGNAIVVNNGQMSWLNITCTWLVTIAVTGLIFGSLTSWVGAIALAISAFVLSMLAFIVARSRRLI